MLPSSSFSDYSVWRFLLLSVVACRTSQLGSAAAARIEKIHSFVIIQLDILVSYIHIFKGSGIPSKRRKLKINIKAYLCSWMLDYHNSIFDLCLNIKEIIILKKKYVLVLTTSIDSIIQNILIMFTGSN